MGGLYLGRLAAFGAVVFLGWQLVGFVAEVVPPEIVVTLCGVTCSAVPAVLPKKNHDSEVPYVPSPPVHAGRLYVVPDDGTFEVSGGAR
jgi:hypothetical protein